MSKDFYNAAVFGDIEAIKSMAAIRPEIVQSRDQHGYTALHGAAGEENLAVIDVLLSLGANINAETNDGITPLHVAVYPRMAKHLISRGSSINARTRSGDTPLIAFAAEAEGIDIIKVLLKCGADPNLKNNHGQTALMIAMQREEMDKVKLLKKHGALA